MAAAGRSAPRSAGSMRPSRWPEIGCSRRGQLLRQFGERGLNQNQAGAGCVVAQPNARRRLRPAGCGGQRLGGLKELDRAGNVLNLANGDGAGAVEHHGVLGGVEDGRFDAMGCRTRIENSVDRPSRSSRTWRRSWGWCGRKYWRWARRWAHRPWRISSKATGCDGMRMPTRGRPAVTAFGDGGGARQQQGKRAGPEGLHETARGLGNLRDQAVEHGVVCDRAGEVDDDGVPRRALFGGRRCGPRRRGRGRWRPARTTVSVGKATRPPARRISAARAMDWLASSVSRWAGSTARRRVFHASIVAVYGRRRHLPYTHRLRMPIETEIKFRWTIPPH